jgi:copper(I)-binding protein
VSRASLTLGCSLLIALSSCASATAIEVGDAWARPLPESAPAAAIFVTIENGTDAEDRLIGVDSPACAVAEVHETTMSGGVMGMKPVGVEGVTLPSGAPVVLEPGGLHVMCIDPLVPFTAGTTVTLTLRFDLAPDAMVEVSVEER